MPDKPFEGKFLRAVPVLNTGEWKLQFRVGVEGDWITSQHFTRDTIIEAMESLLEDVRDIATKVIGAEITRQQEETDEFTKSEWMEGAAAEPRDDADERMFRQQQTRRAGVGA